MEISIPSTMLAYSWGVPPPASSGLKIRSYILWICLWKSSYCLRWNVYISSSIFRLHTVFESFCSLLRNQRGLLWLSSASNYCTEALCWTSLLHYSFTKIIIHNVLPSMYLISDWNLSDLNLYMLYISISCSASSKQNAANCLILLSTVRNYHLQVRSVLHDH